MILREGLQRALYITENSRPILKSDYSFTTLESALQLFSELVKRTVICTRYWLSVVAMRYSCILKGNCYDETAYIKIVSTLNITASSIKYATAETGTYISLTNFAVLTREGVFA